MIWCSMDCCKTQWIGMSIESVSRMVPCPTNKNCNYYYFVLKLKLLGQMLTTQQINEFITNGVLVVPNVLTEDEISDAIDSLHRSLQKYGIVCFVSLCKEWSHRNMI